jgi:hypothetical protein
MLTALLITASDYIGGPLGLIPSAFLVYTLKLKSLDFCNKMENGNFAKWLENQLEVLFLMIHHTTTKTVKFCHIL